MAVRQWPSEEGFALAVLSLMLNVVHVMMLQVEVNSLELMNWCTETEEYILSAHVFLRRVEHFKD